MTNILSIDIGTRNLGYCRWANQHIYDHGVLDLQHYHKGTDYALQIKKLQESGFFDNADIILVEIQMRSCMKTLANTIRCFFWDKTVRIAPQSVKRHFKTFTHKHSTNKKAHIALVKKLHPELDLNKYKKKDDVADAVVQLEYFLQLKKI